MCVCVGSGDAGKQKKQHTGIAADKLLLLALGSFGILARLFLLSLRVVQMEGKTSEMAKQREETKNVP